MSTLTFSNDKSVSHRRSFASQKSHKSAVTRRSGSENLTTHLISPPQPPTGRCATPANYAKYLQIYERFLELVPFRVEEAQELVEPTTRLPPLGKATPARDIKVVSSTCIGCKTNFPSRSKLHQHLSAFPAHKRPINKRVIYTNDRPSSDLKDQIISLPDNEELRAHLTGEFDGDIFAALKTFGMQEISPFGELPGPHFQGKTDHGIVIPPEEDPSPNIRDLTGRLQGVYTANTIYNKYKEGKKIQELSDDEEEVEDPVTQIFNTFPRSITVEGNTYSLTYSSFLRMSPEVKEKVLAGQELTKAEHSNALTIKSASEMAYEKKYKKPPLDLEASSTSLHSFLSIHPDSERLVRPPKNSPASLLTGQPIFDPDPVGTFFSNYQNPVLDPDERIAGPSTNTRDELQFDSD